VSASGLPPDALKFLAELKKHNNKPWFDKNKARYEQSLRDPFVAFCAALAPKLNALSPYIAVVAKPQGGSISRIYRDTRFSKDKTPYKSGLFAHFRHSDADDEGPSPGLYLHVEPGHTVLGAGIWHPSPPQLKSIRDAIVAKPSTWKKVKHGKTWSLHGDALKRPPPGYDPSHEFIDDLKRKDFALMAELTDATVTSSRFASAVISQYQKMLPFFEYISAAVGLPTR
jgi:uncharacterized protein (TIGR02453 family)